MQRNFWATLPRPFFALAPMADVTDVAFREMFARLGKPDVMFTEFVSADGLCSVGRKNLLTELKYTRQQRPIVAQLWGSKPEKFFSAAKFVAGLGFDGIDINMGCPKDREIKNGACAALIKDPNRARAIIQATQSGAGGLPVSVKTRLGYEDVAVEEWVSVLLSSGIAAITLHGRTKKEMSKVPARWDAIARAVALRDRLGSPALIIGNGDVKSMDEARDKAEKFRVDGVMIGRGAFGRPWFFRSATPQAAPAEKITALIQHVELFGLYAGASKNFAILKKHFKAYISNFPQAATLRAALMETGNPDEAVAILQSYLGAMPPSVPVENVPIGEEDVMGNKVLWKEREFVS